MPLWPARPKQARGAHDTCPGACCGAPLRAPAGARSIGDEAACARRRRGGGKDAVAAAGPAVGQPEQARPTCPAPPQAIEKRLQSMTVAMQRAERAAAAGGDKGGRADRARAEPPRRSGRQTQQVGGRPACWHACGCCPAEFASLPAGHGMHGVPACMVLQAGWSLGRTFWKCMQLGRAQHLCRRSRTCPTAPVPRPAARRSTFLTPSPTARLARAFRVLHLSWVPPKWRRLRKRRSRCRSCRKTRVRGLAGPALVPAVRQVRTRMLSGGEQLPRLQQGHLREMPGLRTARRGSCSRLVARIGRGPQGRCFKLLCQGRRVSKTCCRLTGPPAHSTSSHADLACPQHMHP